MNTAEKQTSFAELIQGDQPVLVDFFAEWCGPCKVMKPVLQELKALLGDLVTIVKLDIDKSPETASRFHIKGVPTLILFRKGEILWRQSGVMTAKHLSRILPEHLKS